MYSLRLFPLQVAKNAFERLHLKGEIFDSHMRKVGAGFRNSWFQVMSTVPASNCCLDTSICVILILISFGHCPPCGIRSMEEVMISICLQVKKMKALLFQL